MIKRGLIVRAAGFHRVWSAIGLTAGLTFLGLASQAAADVPKTLCETADMAVAPGDPGVDAQIRAETARTEQLLAAAPGTPRYAPAALTLPAGAAPSLTVRSAYCAAVGEAIRRGGYGNALNASGYLQMAFQFAEQAKANDLSARAAYRLGLTLTQASLTEGDRGAHRRGGPERAAAPSGSRGLGKVASDEDVTRLASLEEPTGQKACEALLDQDLMYRFPRPGMALSCAAVRGDPDLAARSDLEAVRLLLTRANGATAKTAEALRGQAVARAVGRLAAAGPAPSAEITLRLAEAAVDSVKPGDPVDPAILAAIRRVEAALDPANDAVGAGAFAAALEGRIVGLTDPAAGAPYYERALALESRRPSPSRLSDWYMLLADADPAHRADHVRAAYSALAGVRSLLPLRDPLTEESTFQIHERRVFEARIGDVLAAIPTVAPRAGGREALSLTRDQQAQLAEAQDILENFRQAEVSDALGNECMTVPLRVQSQQLTSEELILYPVLLPDRVEVIYLRGDGNGQFRRLPPNTAYNRAKVALLVNGLREDLTENPAANSGKWRKPADELYRLLIGPVEGQLDPNKTLVVIPDATLSALPFAALRPLDDKRFLIEKTRLVIAPSLAYAQPGLVRQGRQAFVAAGSLDRDVPLAFGQSFAKLANAAGEAKLAAGWDGANHVKPGRYMPDFTADDLRKALRTEPVDILHLATHASFSGGADKSFIVANGGFIGLRELSQIIADNKAHGKLLDLLVLSACETAVGDDSSSLGLAGAAVQSGARGAIASLWPVDDESTKNLMVNFYKSYRSGAAKGEAIRYAEMTVMKRNPNPYYWGSLILVGGWR